MKNLNFLFFFTIGCLSVFISSKAQAQATTINFSADKTSGCGSVVVKFSDASTGNPVSWSWDLGNGTSTLEKPEAIYSSPGDYDIKLTVTYADGSSKTLTKAKFIRVFNFPEVDFSATNTQGCETVTTTFKDLSKAGSGNINAWEWNFGDGTQSNLQNPTHTYNSPGNYGVILKVTNSEGCSKSTFKSPLVTVGGLVKADFDFASSPSCKLPVSVLFSNKSTTYATMEYAWQFGDASSSTSTNPTHDYASYGSFNVTLTAKSSGGCTSTFQKLVTLKAGESSFTGPANVCIGTAATYTSSSASTSNINYLWDMGDGTTYTTKAVSHLYKATGTYTIKLRNDFGGCIDSSSQQIVVNALPKIDFDALNFSSCQIPATVNFVDKTANATAWLWSFGNGKASTLQNPSSTYSVFGNYSITLKATSDKGCVDSVTKTDFIKIQKPSVTIANLPANACVPYNFKPSYSTNFSDSITSYFWDFGDGNTSTSSNPSNSYNKVGSYTVKLFFTTNSGCKDSAVYVNGVNIGDKVAVDFTAAPTPVCGTQPVQFLATANNVSSYDWDFGDGVTGSGQNPKHQYKQAGTFNVKLSVSNNGCVSSVLKPNYITVNGPISVIDFTKDCTVPGKIIFTSKSISAETHTWSFGDGNGSNVNNPTHIYTKSGNYIVKLITTNSNGCADTSSTTVPVWLEKFTVSASTDTVCKGSRVTITVTHPSPNQVSSYYLDFGGPGNQTQNAGNNTTLGWDYKQVGTYGFFGVAIDVYGCRDSVTIFPFMRVNGPSPDFDADISKGCLGTTINFKDNSGTDGLHKIIKWQWDFGDGTLQTFTAPPFTHQYKASGTYTVKLTVTDESGCSDTYTRKDYIFIADGSPAFTSADTLSCFGKDVVFKDLSTGSIQSYYWSFGNGQTSTLQNPTHLYTDTGVYTVKLITTTTSGCVDSVVKKDFITVKKPRVNFSFVDTGATCAPLQIQFKDSSYYIKDWSWNFGDGNTSTVKNPANIFYIPGNYRVKLTGTSFGGCVDSAFATVKVPGPNGVLSYGALMACKNEGINYKVATNGAVSFTWDFNDGLITTTTDSSITHQYSKAGKFIPKVILRDAFGCALTVQGKDTITIEGATPKFGASPKVLCDSGMVQFTDSTTSVGSSLTYKWNLGNGTTSILKNPGSLYNKTGFYSVQLTTTTSLGCVDTVSYKNYIKVVASPKMQIEGDSTGCAPASMLFTTSTVVDTSAIVSWQWKFGNGNTSNLQNPSSQIFNTAGTFINTLVVTNSSGCTATLNKAVKIYAAIPVVVSRDTTICLGDSITLSASNGASYKWSSTTPTISCLDCATPTVYPKTTQYYKVVSTTTTGCQSTDSVLVKVLQPYKLSVTNNNIVCLGQKVQLKASGAPMYMWSPSATLSAINIADPFANPVINTTYKVIGYDSLGCFTDSAFAVVNVVTAPTVDLGPDLTLAAGATKLLSPIVSSDVVKYAWSPSLGLSCTNCATPVLTAFGNYTYVLKVSNAGNCSAQDSLKVITSCNNTQVYIPNTFSPNGDGTNDIFYPRGTGSFIVNYMKIYNRWGETVFEKKYVPVNNPSSGWTGMFNGKPAASGVYTYYLEVICTDSQILKYFGNLTLIQ